MSWDLYLLPPEAADDPNAWLEENEEGQNEQLARQHASAVVARRPDLQLGGPYGASYQLTVPEETELPLDVGLYGNHASISVAYWDLGPRATELADIVVEVASILVNEAGWLLYDPQEDRIIAIDELSAAFGSGHAYGVTAVERITSEQEPKPKKRRFGLF